ncbi:hypothetical protein EV188_11625 [Actinomycetospora succinea]|uniref:DUF1254 domain-containing protein n=1 Tax=Actinomycetospora succinea TaxID=663603 RepID=A0A4V3D745_9PSEU|nr:DUF1254 domain-containing protein [Actinomycetospora succinea]TDQ46397.1 hypothetical protein EV188_11625 [Actinomycetospora succinea]
MADLEQARATIAVPDRVDSPFGELRFFDGVPTQDSITTIYDMLDLTRAIEVYLNTVPGASLVAMRRGFRSIGVDGNTVLGYTAPRANSRSFALTPNTETTYGTMFLDLRDGPLVVENPPNSLCVLDDFWFRYVADLGIAGPDRGAGGKYVLLPPGHDGPEPDGYVVLRPPTFTNWLVVRALGGVDDITRTRVYPLEKAADPPAMTYIDIAVHHFNTVHANDASFYEEIDTLVQEEPPEALDPERAGQCEAIGIVHGRPFAPDERMRGILEQGARLAAAASRALVYAPRDPAAHRYPGSNWLDLFPSGSYEFLRDHARLLDARVQFHYVATVITPAMAHAQVGAGSAYVYTAQAADGAWLDGGRSYRLHLSAGIPAKNFWSVDVYDTQTRSLLETDDPYPSVMSLDERVAVNPDGSADVWFGPTAPAGHEANWVQTVPGKSWFTILRLYGPLEGWFDKTWQPGEIEPTP